MTAGRQSPEARIEELQARLMEAEETLRAIRQGEVDAVVVKGAGGDTVYTLRDAAEPYRMLVEHMSDGALTVNSDATIVYCNACFARMLGYPRNALLGVSLGAFMEEQSRSVLDTLLCSRGRRARVVQMTTANGDPVTLHLSAAPLGDVHCLVAADLTHQSAWSRMVAVIEESEDAIFSLDTHYLVENWNCGARRVFGLGDDEAIGRPMTALFPAAAAGELEQAFEVVRAGRSTRIQVGVKNHSEAIVSQLDLSIAPLRDPGGELLGVSVVGHDVTARLSVEQALRDAARRKDEFLAMLGHELRNPLAAIRNAAGLLKLLGTDDERKRSAFDVLDRQSGQMVRLVDGLLEVSRIARGKVDLSYKTLDLRGVLQSVVEDWGSQTVQKNLTLSVHLPRDAMWVSGDDARLTQVFDNLLGNAVKFTGPGGHIELRLEADPDWVVARVIDNGMGIPPDMLPHIFEPFQQGTRNASQTADGLGLGLALAKMLVELHKGEITVASRGPATGTAVSVRLPHGPASVELDEPEPEIRAARRRILIVEDNVDAAQMLSELLAMRGHDVAIAETADKALDILRKQGADVALCDLGLPGMDGYELARIIRDDMSLRATRLVALTGYGQPTDRRKSLSAGFDGHLTKPVTAGAIDGMLVRLGEGAVR